MERTKEAAVSLRALLALVGGGILVAAVALASSCAGEAGSSGGCDPPPGCTSGVCCNESNLCVEQDCSGTPYSCSLAAGGRFEWVAGGALCDDGDACTVGDRCSQGQCAGTPDPCDSPPPSVCDNRTVVHYRIPGTCRNGQCQYVADHVECPEGCSEGRCLGEPCKGVTCDSAAPCFDEPGRCVDGKCEYDPSPAGTACQTMESCAIGQCDGAGRCEATSNSCEAPHATGGTCVDGVCQNFTCEAGWGNCNSDWSDGCESQLGTVEACSGCSDECKAAHATARCEGGSCKYDCADGWGNCDNDWSDGCETSLTTANNCGQCGKRCPSGPHATASCTSSGTCKLSCTAPWQNCNNDAADGCEIPVGIPNQCDRDGLNKDTGCGTAYCGAAISTNSENFGSWTCTFCSHCHLWSDGWSWCLSGSGTFSHDRCDSCCNAGLADQVCPQ